MITTVPRACAAAGIHPPAQHSVERLAVQSLNEVKHELVRPILRVVAMAANPAFARGNEIAITTAVVAGTGEWMKPPIMLKAV